MPWKHKVVVTRSAMSGREQLKVVDLMVFWDGRTGVDKGRRYTKICSGISAEDLGLGGLYDFLPPPDPEKDKAGCMQLFAE